MRDAYLPISYNIYPWINVVKKIHLQAHIANRTVSMGKRTIGILIIIVTVLVIGYLVADHFLNNRIQSKRVTENGLQANFLAAEDADHETAVILVGGGQWGDYWATEFARKGMAGLSLPYTRKEGLPPLPEEIDLEYFEKAIDWLQRQDEVNPDKIVVMGASRNAELALVIASTFPELVSGVVAYAPSAVSWSNTVLPFNSDRVKASWTYKDKDIPYVAMEKITGGAQDTLNTLAYWKQGLEKKADVERAAIKVEQINGPILLFSGKDDQVWPSAQMADMIARRLDSANFTPSIQNIQYQNAGHLISGNPDDASYSGTGTMNIAGRDYTFEYGGTAEGDLQAKQDAREKLFAYLEKI